MWTFYDDALFYLRKSNGAAVSIITGWSQSEQEINDNWFQSNLYITEHPKINLYSLSVGF